jgi:hypothetical protein
MDVTTYRPKKSTYWIIGIVILLELIIFKRCYPQAGFIHDDSYAYLQAAASNQDIGIFPIGYSKFLRLFSVFTYSDTALVIFQYLALETSTFWLIQTLSAIFSPKKLTKVFILIFFVFNPVLLFLANYVSSDALFLALSITWFTLLIRIIQSPTTGLIICQISVLFLSFIVRYSALYYPFLSALAFLLSPLPLKKKLVSIVGSTLPIALFVWYSSTLYYKLTGIREFSPFSGWQLANNALNAYRYIDHAHRKAPPSNLRALDQAVRQYFDTTRNLRLHPEEMMAAGTYYMWTQPSPLQMFMRQQTSKDSSYDFLTNWASMGPLYSAYAKWLIRAYPAAYFRHYLVPNMINFYVPPVEFLDQYNNGYNDINQIAQQWFKFKSNKVKPVFGGGQVKTLLFMPFALALINLAFLLGCVGWTLLIGVEPGSNCKKVIFLTISLWIVNFAFSVFASRITLRYQLFDFQAFGSFAFLLIDRIYRRAFDLK